MDSDFEGGALAYERLSDGIETAFRLCSALGEVINTTSTRFSDMCGSALMHWFQKHRVFLVLDEGLGRLASRIIYIFFFSHVRDYS